MSTARQSGPDTRERIRDLQTGKLRRLIERCEQNPFYAPRLARSGITSASLRGVEDLRALEPLSKEDILADQDANPPFGSRLGIRPEEVRQIHLTSGSSGIGQEAMALTAGDMEQSGASWVTALAAAGLTPGDLFAIFYPVTLFAYGQSVLCGGRATGIPVVSLAGLDRSVALALLRRLQPRALGARPALFGLLAEEMAADGVLPSAALPGLRSLITSGLSVTQAITLEETWGATVHEVYGMSQAAGLIAGTGTEGAAPGGYAGVMRCYETQCLVEAVHPETLEPVEEGEAELLLTCFERTASPILRFRTRDRVEIVPPESYGDGAPFLGLRVGSIGRWDDMLKIRGNNVWPSQLDEALLGCPAVLDYLAELVVDERGVEQLQVRVRADASAPPNGDGSSLEAMISRRVKAGTNVRPAVCLDSDLPPPGLKPRRLIDRRSG